jgi:hypothetical protein
MDFASHPRESSLGEVRQAIAMLVAFQHPKSHHPVQDGTRNRHCRAQSVPDGAEHRFFFWLEDDLEHDGSGRRKQAAQGPGGRDRRMASAS